ncbi:MAG: hypothetical protein WDN69_04520 [Aliidongia sp.]
MQSLTLLSQMIRRKLVGDPPPRDMFKPGMFLSLSAIPFLLSDDATHIGAPEIDGADIKTNIGDVSYVDCGDLQLVRLHVPEVEGQPGFFQIELDDQGSIAECRFFREIDVVYPQTEDEWFLWVNPYYGKPDRLQPDDPSYPRAYEVAQILPMIGAPAIPADRRHLVRSALVAERLQPRSLRLHRDRIRSRSPDRCRARMAVDAVFAGAGSARAGTGSRIYSGQPGRAGRGGVDPDPLRHRHPGQFDHGGVTAGESGGYPAARLEARRGGPPRRTSRRLRIE